MSSPNNTPKPSDSEPNVAGVATLGFGFAAALIGFGYAGQWLDQKFNSAPICLMIGVFFGGGGTFYLSYKRLMAPRSPK